MSRDFFVKVVFGTHKVADMLPQGMPIKKLANQLLGDLLLFCDTNPVTLEQKRNILPRTLREIESLVIELHKVRTLSSINPQNFLILEKEYKKIPPMLIAFLEQNRAEPVGAKPGSAQLSLTLRQKKILELLKNKEKTQVWELQKVLPEVTKRTLRRDLDSLLTLNLVERKGEWNNVFYVLAG